MPKKNFMKEEDQRLIEHMLEEVESELEQKGRENHFIESLREQWTNRGWLSVNQIEALRKFYENV